LKEIVGDSAFDYAHVILAFHYMNRIADTLGVTPEVFPLRMRHFESLRKASVQLMGFFMTRMDLNNRAYDVSYQEALLRTTPVFKAITGREPENDFELFQTRPKLVEVMQILMEDRQGRTGLDTITIEKVQRTVEEALPADVTQAESIAPRPKDPIEDFAFTGTRCAYRTTPEMIQSLRDAGYDDTDILDLAIIVADANLWARAHRLYGLDPSLIYL
jgi:hypothetical protein